MWSRTSTSSIRATLRSRCSLTAILSSSTSPFAALSSGAATRRFVWSNTRRPASTNRSRIRSSASSCKRYSLGSQSGAKTSIHSFCAKLSGFRLRELALCFRSLNSQLLRSRVLGFYSASVRSISGSTEYQSHLKRTTETKQVVRSEVFHERANMQERMADLDHRRCRSSYHICPFYRFAFANLAGDRGL